jgi:hypothetical protein
MKHIFFKCFKVDDAVKDGIDDFNRLSGCKKLPVTAREKTKQPNGKGLLLLLSVLVIKLFK